MKASLSSDEGKLRKVFTSISNMKEMLKQVLQKKEMIPKGNLEILECRKSNRNSKCLGRYNRLSTPILNSLKYTYQQKTKIVSLCGRMCMNYIYVILYN